MTYSLCAAGLVISLAAAGAAVAQHPQYPTPQMPQSVAGAPMGPMGQMTQMSPMMGQSNAMMNDPRMQAHMTKMMRGCQPTMAQMQPMHHGERRTR